MSNQQREYYTVESRKLDTSGRVRLDWDSIGKHSYCRGMDLGSEWDDPEKLKEYLALYIGDTNPSLWDTYRYEYRIVKVKVEVEEWREGRREE